MINCKSPPAAVLCGYHGLESPPLWSLQSLCDNYTHCDILGGWVCLWFMHGYTPSSSPSDSIIQVLKLGGHCWVVGNSVYHQGGKEWVSPTMFSKSLSFSCPFPLPLSTSQMESISLTRFHALQVKIGPDRLTCHSRAVRPQLLNQNQILSLLILDKPAWNICNHNTNV